MKTVDPIARRLLEAFTKFRRLHKKQIPVSGLKSSEVWLLFCIKKMLSTESPGIKVSDISNAMDVAAPTITQLVNGLEKKGFVKRSMDEADRRAVRVRLTPKGEEIVTEASNAFYDSFNGLAQYLGEKQSNELAELLSKVYEYFNKVRDKD